MTLSSEIRKQRKRAAVERWKEANYDYYLAQKRALAHRPEYLAHRRRLYREKKEMARWNTEECFLYHNQINLDEFEGQCETSD